jgi:hypothetical protein
MTATLRKRATVKGHPLPPTLTIINNTTLTLEEIRELPRYGGFMNYWRQRKVEVYQPSVEYLKEHPETVISVGYNFTENKYWICEEPFSAYSSRILNADWSDYR